MKSKGRRELINEIKDLRRELGLEERTRMIEKRAANTSVWEVYHNEDGAFIGFGTCESIHVTDEWHATKEAAEAAKERLENTGGHCFYYVAERKTGAE